MRLFLQSFQSSNRSYLSLMLVLQRTDLVIDSGQDVVLVVRTQDKP